MISTLSVLRQTLSMLLSLLLQFTRAYNSANVFSVIKRILEMLSTPLKRLKIKLQSIPHLRSRLSRDKPRLQRLTSTLLFVVLNDRRARR